MTTPAAGQLPACPSSPNCVCSDDPPGSHHIAPLRLRPGDGRGAEGIGRLRAAVEAVVTTLPGARVVSSVDRRVTVEFRSRLFGFVDDVLFDIRPEEGAIAVRAAARSGWWDLGVNRRRLETIRARLAGAGFVEPA